MNACNSVESMSDGPSLGLPLRGTIAGASAAGLSGCSGMLGTFALETSAGATAAAVCSPVTLLDACAVGASGEVLAVEAVLTGAGIELVEVEAALGTIGGEVLAVEAAEVEALGEL